MATKTKKGPSLPNLETLIQAGIDPKTGLPVKMVEGSNYKDGIKRQLRIMDEQNAVNRYVWHNLPGDITSQELERLLYYKGQLCFFYDKISNNFYFMPYALDGGIDFYGRFNRIHPVPMAEGASKEEKVQIERLRAYLSTLKLDVIYDIPLDVDGSFDPEKCCILLHDYTKQLSQTITPRQLLQEPLLDIMADCIPFMRTALMNSTGVLGMRVNNQDEYSNVVAANATLEAAAREGRRYIPVVGNMEFQEMTSDNVIEAQGFMQAMQSLDNYRLSLYGLDNGGLFQKNTHMLQAEQEMNQGNSNLVLDDGLLIRQNFCTLANILWGTIMSCEVAEPVMNQDMNLDGMIGNNGPDPAGSPQEVGGTQNA